MAMFTLGDYRFAVPAPLARYPGCALLIAIFGLLSGVLLLGGLIYRAMRFVWTCCSHATRRVRSLRQQMRTVQCFEDWQALASDLDAINDASRGKSKPPEQHYDSKLLEAKMRELNALRAAGKVDALVFALRADLFRNFGNITSRDLHSGRHILPQGIRDYIQSVEACLEFIMETESTMSMQNKVSFFQEARHAFGRTALVLSGGGALGAFHLGVVRGLIERGLLPRIIAGSSVGAIVAAIVAVHKDHELQEMYLNINEFNLSFFANNSTYQALGHYLTKGTLQDIVFLVKRLRALLADVTFLEAYERTGRMLNVTVTAADTLEPPRMLNYLTAPHAVVWSAVAASSAFPGLFPAQELLARDSHGRFVKFAAPTDDGVRRRWHDGSLENDLPFRQLSELFNVNHFVVSQTNPHLVPLMTLKTVMPGMMFNLMETEVKHAFLQAQHYLPRWMPTKWMRLFTQPWEGDVTIVMPWSLYSRSISKAMYNPSQAELVEADRLGRLSAWEHMSAIQGNCAIEMKLDHCLTQIEQRAGERGNVPPTRGSVTVPERPSRMNLGSGTKGSRIPSWLHLPHLPAFNVTVPMTRAVARDASPRNMSASPDTTQAALVQALSHGALRTGLGATGDAVARQAGSLHVPGSPEHQTPVALAFEGTGEPGFTVASASSSSGEGFAGHSGPGVTGWQSPRVVRSRRDGSQAEHVVSPDDSLVGNQSAAQPGPGEVPGDGSDDFWAGFLASRVRALPGLSHAHPSTFALDVIAP